MSHSYQHHQPHALGAGSQQIGPGSPGIHQQRPSGPGQCHPQMNKAISAPGQNQQQLFPQQLIHMAANHMVAPANPSAAAVMAHMMRFTGSNPPSAHGVPVSNTAGSTTMRENAASERNTALLNDAVANVGSDLKFPLGADVKLEALSSIPVPGSENPGGGSLVSPQNLPVPLSITVRNQKG